MKISRRDLYQRVWQTPIRTLAREFDISDVGLSKACRRHEIPTPPPGYWSKVEHGKSVSRPAMGGSGDELVTLDAEKHRLPAVADSVPAAAAVVINVRDSTSEALAPIAAATLGALSKAKPTDGGFVNCGSTQVAHCSLSGQTVRRAAEVLDALERALLQVDAALVHDKDGKRVAVRVRGELLGLSLTEGYKRSETVVKHPKYSYLDRREYQYEFNGQLKLSLEGAYAGRKSWSDGTRGRLENKLVAVVQGVVAAAEAVVRLRQEREAQARHWAEQRALWEAAEKRRQQRKSFAEGLAKEAQAWQHHVDLARYLQALSDAIGDTELPPEARAWLALAEELVGEMSPIARRISALRGPSEGGAWYGPFGKPVV